MLASRRRSRRSIYKRSIKAQHLQRSILLAQHHAAIMQHQGADLRRRLMQHLLGAGYLAQHLQHLKAQIYSSIYSITAQHLQHPMAQHLKVLHMRSIYSSI
jgi:hypothetical protein